MGHAGRRCERGKLTLVRGVPAPVAPIHVSGRGHRVALTCFRRQDAMSCVKTMRNVPIYFSTGRYTTSAFPLTGVRPRRIRFVRTFRGRKKITFFLVFCDRRGRFCCLALHDLLAF